MSLYNSIYSSIFPWLSDDDNSQDTSNQPQAQPTPQPDSFRIPPVLPTLAVQRQNEPIPTTTNDVSQLTPQAQPQIDTAQYGPVGTTAVQPDFTPWTTNTSPVSGSGAAQIADLEAIGRAARLGQRAPDNAGTFTAPPVGLMEHQGGGDLSGSPLNQPPDNNSNSINQLPYASSNISEPTAGLTQKQQKAADKLPPPFTPPYANIDPDDPNADIKRQKNKVAQLEYNVQYPQNPNHGFKARLGDIVRNYLYGLSQAPPGANVKQTLLMGGVGAGLGVANPNWSAQREAQAQLPGAQRDLQNTIDQTKQQADIVNAQAKPEQVAAEEQRKQDKDAVDAEYKQNVVSLGKEKADNIKAYREQLVELKHQGMGQGDQRIRLLQQRIENEKARTQETVRHNTETEAQGAIREEGRNKRQDKSLGAAKDRQVSGQNFTRTQKDIDRHNQLTKWLAQKGFDAVKYHGWLDTQVKQRKMTSESAAAAKADYDKMLANTTPE